MSVGYKGRYGEGLLGVWPVEREVFESQEGKWTFFESAEGQAVKFTLLAYIGGPALGMTWL